MSKRLPPRITRRRKRLLWGVFLVLIGGGLGWFIFLTPFFLIKNISVRVEGEATIPPTQMEEALVDLKNKNSSILLFSPEQWERRLREHFSELASVNVNRRLVRFPPFRKTDWLVNEVEVKILERQALGVTCRPSTTLGAGERCYFFDRDGILFRDFGDSTRLATGGTPHTPFIADKRNVAYELRYQVFSPETVERLTDLLKHSPALVRPIRQAQGGLGSPQADVSINHLEFADYETTLVTSEGWGLIFTNARPFNEQLEAVRLVLEKEIGPRRGELEYIDATIRNRVYYRYRQ